MATTSTRFKISPATDRGERCLLERLGEQWPAGAQLPPVRELAAMLNVAPGTAHRAVRKLIKDGLLMSRPRTGVFVTDQFTNAQLRDLCYWRRNPRPQSMRNKTIEVVYTSLYRDTFIMRMVQVFEEEIKGRGGSIRRHMLKEGMNRVDKLDSRGVDGFAVFNLGIDDEQVPGKVPLVWVSTSTHDGPRHALNYDVISIDQTHGAMIAAEALRQAGCERVCVLGVVNSEDELHPVTRIRMQGFSEALKDNASITLLRARWFGQIPGAQLAAEYLKMQPRPTGVFALSDELAVGFVHGAAAHGLVAGRDYRIVGFDGQDVALKLDGGPLTTVGVPIHELGRRAAETLEARLADAQISPQRILLRCKLIEGATAQAVKTEAEK